MGKFAKPYKKKKNNNKEERISRVIILTDVKKHSGEILFLVYVDSKHCNTTTILNSTCAFCSGLEEPHDPIQQSLAQTQLIMCVEH